MEQKTFEPTPLLSKLLKLQSELGAVVKSGTANTPKFSYSYIEINAILEEVVPQLSLQGLLLLQPLEDGHVVSRILDPASGESVESSLPLPDVRGDCQAMGSAITYYRRYTLQSLLGLRAKDDDGQAAQPKPVKPWWETNGFRTADEAQTSRDQLRRDMKLLIDSACDGDPDHQLFASFKRSITTLGALGQDPDQEWFQKLVPVDALTFKAWEATNEKLQKIMTNTEPWEPSETTHPEPPTPDDQVPETLPLEGPQS